MQVPGHYYYIQHELIIQEKYMKQVIYRRKYKSD
jgi:hypothetical protein